MPSEQTAGPDLLALKQRLDAQEQGYMSPFATPSRDGIRRRPEAKAGHRQAFALDGDRILHSRAYTRYIDKTQVFYLIRNDHITHRVLHVQLVSKIARTIGRFLRLNEDLIEAIALGHDIGHPPFGHDGEKVLSALCLAHDLPAFQHNIQSVRFLDKIEKNGRGWNLTLQTLDGILCHDGEVHARALRPSRGKFFADLDQEISRKAADPAADLVPMSLEGCVVRFSDTIGYIGRDIEDAIELKLISRDEIPVNCQKFLGSTNGTIVYRLVEDLITNTFRIAAEENTGDQNDRTGDAIGFSPEVAESLRELKEFNYERIYLNPKIKRGLDKIKVCYEVMFARFLEQITVDARQSTIVTEFLGRMDPVYRDANSPAAMVRDFIAGMTDDYFLRQAGFLGCEVPMWS
jgi:dGTPase